MIFLIIGQNPRPNIKLPQKSSAQKIDPNKGNSNKNVAFYTDGVQTMGPISNELVGKSEQPKLPQFASNVSGLVKNFEIKSQNLSLFKNLLKRSIKIGEIGPILESKSSSNLSLVTGSSQKTGLIGDI